jgi:endoglucanase
MEMSGSTRLEFLPSAYFTKTYGNNRADYSFIAGGVVPGIIIVKPDFPENKDDWPFLWGENEYVINLAASYLYLVHAANDLLNEPTRGASP